MRVGRFAEEEISDLVGVLVVDLLESVQVDVQQRDLTAGFAGFVDTAFDQFIHVEAVRESGQAIAIGSDRHLVVVRDLLLIELVQLLALHEAVDQIQDGGAEVAQEMGFAGEQVSEDEGTEEQAHGGGDQPALVHEQIDRRKGDCGVVEEQHQDVAVVAAEKVDGDTGDHAPGCGTGEENADMEALGPVGPGQVLRRSRPTRLARRMACAIAELIPSHIRSGARWSRPVVTATRTMHAGCAQTPCFDRSARSCCTLKDSFARLLKVHMDPLSTEFAQT